MPALRRPGLRVSVNRPNAHRRCRNRRGTGFRRNRGKNGGRKGVCGKTGRLGGRGSRRRRCRSRYSLLRRGKTAGRARRCNRWRRHQPIGRCRTSDRVTIQSRRTLLAAIRRARSGRIRPRQKSGCRSPNARFLPTPPASRLPWQSRRRRW